MGLIMCVYGILMQLREESRVFHGSRSASVVCRCGAYFSFTNKSIATSGICNFVAFELR